MPLVKGSRVDQREELSPHKTSHGNPYLRGLAQLGQGVAEGAAGLAGLPGSILDTVIGTPEITGKPFFPTSGNLQEGVRSIAKKVLPEGYTEPQGTTEKFLRNIGSSIPGAGLALATGGAALPIGISATGGAIGETAAEELGGGPIAQFAASLAGSALGSRSFHKLQKRYGISPKNLTATSEAAQSKLYNLEKELGKDINFPAKDYQKKLLNLEHRASKSGAMPKSQKDDIIDKIQEALADIKKGEINASQLVTRKQENNAFYKHFKGEKNKEAREYLDQIQKIIFETGDEIGKGHNANPITSPKWREAWRDADDITKALKFGQRADEAQELLDKVMDVVKNPITKSLLSGAAGAGGTLLSGGGLPTAAIVGTLGAGAYQGIRQGKYLYNFTKAPATRKLLKQAAHYSLERQIPQLTKTLQQIDKSADKYAEKHPESLREARSFGGPRGGGLVKGKKL